MSKTQSIRDALKAAAPGGLSSQQIAQATGLPASIVTSLMAWDMRQGRISVHDEIYYLIDQREVAIRKAVQLLESVGYRVTRA